MLIFSIFIVKKEKFKEGIKIYIFYVSITSIGNLFTFIVVNLNHILQLQEL
jgi:hypothetical protein